MPNLKGSIFCKALALVLCVFLAFEVSYIQAYQATDQMRGQFNSAKEAYFADDFEGTKITLENLESSIAQLEGMDSFKGEVYLLLGAAYEKLEFNNLAIKYFCLAKDILGEGKSIEGLDLNSLTLYWTQCQTAGGIAISVLIIQYEDGYRSYLAGDYDGAKVTLEGLVSIIETLEGFESLKGETYLVLGAAYEALKYKELSIKYRRHNSKNCRVLHRPGVRRSSEAGMEIRRSGCSEFCPALYLHVLWSCLAEAVCPSSRSRYRCHSGGGSCLL